MAQQASSDIKWWRGLPYQGLIAERLEVTYRIRDRAWQRRRDWAWLDDYFANDFADWDSAIPSHIQVYRVPHPLLPFIAADVGVDPTLWRPYFRPLAKPPDPGIPGRLEFGVRVDGWRWAVYLFWCGWVNALRWRWKVRTGLQVVGYWLGIVKVIPGCVDGGYWPWQLGYWVYRNAKKWNGETYRPPLIRDLRHILQADWW